MDFPDLNWCSTDQQLSGITRFHRVIHGEWNFLSGGVVLGLAHYRIRKELFCNSEVQQLLLLILELKNNFVLPSCSWFRPKSCAPSSSSSTKTQFLWGKGYTIIAGTPPTIALSLCLPARSRTASPYCCSHHATAFLKLWQKPFFLNIHLDLHFEKSPRGNGAGTRGFMGVSLLP